MEIKQFIWDLVDSNSWLIVEKNNGLLFDAVDSTELYNSVFDLDSLIVVISHSHFDHIVGLNRLRALKSDVTVLSTFQCSENIGNQNINMSSIADTFFSIYHKGNNWNCTIEPFTCSSSNQTFENQYAFEWNGHYVKLISVYGHSNDGLIALVDDKILFSGDTLLPVPTVTRFPNGNSKRFWLEDIPLLQGLTDIEIVFPGHGKPGRLDKMLEINKMPERFIRL